MLGLSLAARSRMLAGTGCAVALSWVFSIGWYFTGAHYGFVWTYAVVDGALAVFFWSQSRGRWFPVPLFFLHAALVLYYVYVAALGVKSWFWIAAFVNRLFDLELLYVGGCALYRIRLLKRRRRAANENGRTAFMRDPAADLLRLAVQSNSFAQRRFGRDFQWPR